MPIHLRFLEREFCEYIHLMLLLLLFHLDFEKLIKRFEQWMAFIHLVYNSFKATLSF